MANRLDKIQSDGVRNDKEKLDKMFEDIRKMEVIPFGYILDFLIGQGLTLQQVVQWYKDRGIESRMIG